MVTASEIPLALIAEPSNPVAATLGGYLEKAGFAHKTVRFLDEAVQAVREGHPQIVFTSASSHFDGETLCQRLKKSEPLLPVVLIYTPDAHDPDGQAADAGADAYLVGPLKRGTVVSCARTMLRIRELHETVNRLEGDLKQSVADAASSSQSPSPSAKGQAEPAAQTEFEFFKKFLLMEVKRSRRYRYPVSFLLVGLDHHAERASKMGRDALKLLLTEALSVISQSVRDIDVAVPFSEGRYLLFLPHTPRSGAHVVATRVRDRIAEMTSAEKLTASIGLAAFEPSDKPDQVSFGTLMKDATDALRRAQSEGGNQIASAGNEPDAAPKDRIVLT